MTNFMPDPLHPRPCDQCRHFGQWLPIQVGDEIRHDVHCWCARPANLGVIAMPNGGCAYWDRNVVLAQIFSHKTDPNVTTKQTELNLIDFPEKDR